MTRVGAMALAASVLVAAQGCRLDDDETEGELGEGAFRYLCVDDSDTACEDGRATRFPTQISVGARFGLSARNLPWELDAEIDGEVVAASATFIAPIEHTDDIPASLRYPFEARATGSPRSGPPSRSRPRRAPTSSSSWTAARGMKSRVLPPEW